MLRTERSTGTVIKFEKSEEKREKDNGEEEVMEFYQPMIRFTTLSGEEIVFRDMFTYSDPKFKAGDKVRVIYDPAKPSKAKILSHYNIFLAFVIFMAVAVPLIILGGGYFFTQRYLQ